MKAELWVNGAKKTDGDLKIVKGQMNYVRADSFGSSEMIPTHKDPDRFVFRPSSPVAANLNDSVEFRVGNLSISVLVTSWGATLSGVVQGGDGGDDDLGS